MRHSHVYSVRLTTWALCCSGLTAQHNALSHFTTVFRLWNLLCLLKSRYGNILYGGSNTTATLYQCEVQLFSSLVFSGMPTHCTQQHQVCGHAPPQAYVQAGRAHSDLPFLGPPQGAQEPTGMRQTKLGTTPLLSLQRTLLAMQYTGACGGRTAGKNCCLEHLRMLVVLIVQKQRQAGVAERCHHE